MGNPVDVSPEIKELTDLWSQIQKTFFVAQAKMKIYLKERGFNSTKEQPYNWKKNPAKLNSNEMIILGHLGVIITTMLSLNDSQNRLEIAMQLKDWEKSDVIKLIKNMKNLLNKIQALFKSYPSQLPTFDRLYCHTTTIPEA